MSQEKKPIRLEMTVDSLERLEIVNPILKEIAERVNAERTGFDFSLSFTLQI